MEAIVKVKPRISGFPSSIVTHTQHTMYEDLFAGTDARSGFFSGVKERR